MKKIIPYLFEDFLLLGFDTKIIQQFGGIPTFTVFIGDDQKLHLVSNEMIKNGQQSEKI